MVRRSTLPFYLGVILEYLKHLESLFAIHFTFLQLHIQTLEQTSKKYQVYSGTLHQTKRLTAALTSLLDRLEYEYITETELASEEALELTASAVKFFSELGGTIEVPQESLNELKQEHRNVLRELSEDEEETVKNIRSRFKSMKEKIEKFEQRLDQI